MPSELVLHLKIVIRDDKSKAVLTMPPVPITERKPIPQLGDLTVDVKNIYVPDLSKRNSFDDKTQSERRQREEAGIGDRYYKLQPYSMPKADKSLTGTMLDVCCKFTMKKGNTTFRWCQGEVIEVSDGKNMKISNTRTRCYKEVESYLIQWDAV